ncbi:MAG: hypothetical protein IKV28_03670 [Bacteroidales bacterium]|nr:hypothetical protein [Bacteroidales bacterium]
MIKVRHFLLVALLVILLQAVIDKYLTLNSNLYLILAPIIVFLMPIQLRGIPMLLAAFGIGLLSDLLGNGILGLNASAMTAMVLLRYPLIRAFTNENSLEKYPYPCQLSMGSGRFFLYLVLLYFLFLSIYILWEGAGILPSPLLVGRIVVGTVINAALGFLFTWLIIREE